MPICRLKSTLHAVKIRLSYCHVRHRSMGCRLILFTRPMVGHGCVHLKKAPDIVRREPYSVILLKDFDNVHQGVIRWGDDLDARH